jgi:hypothetical protein
MMRIKGLAEGGARAAGQGFDPIFAYLQADATRRNSRVRSDGQAWFIAS